MPNFLSIGLPNLVTLHNAILKVIVQSICVIAKPKLNKNNTFW